MKLLAIFVACMLATVLGTSDHEKRQASTPASGTGSGTAGGATQAPADTDDSGDASSEEFSPSKVRSIRLND